LPEGFDKLMIEWRNVRAYGLNPRAAIALGDGGERFVEFIPYRHNVEHEAIGTMFLRRGDIQELFSIGLDERWSKGTKGIAKLYFDVDGIFHLRTARISEV